MEWLQNNPIMAHEEIEFVMKQVDDFDEVFKVGIAECITEEEAKENVWSGALPYLHMYHVMMDDQVRVALLEMLC
jgi:hypothetical protein